jgi:hypothetical protein
MQEADARLAPRLGPDELERIVSLIPDEWLSDPRFEGPAQEREAYRRYLQTRLEARDTWVARAEAARREAQRDVA